MGPPRDRTLRAPRRASADPGIESLEQRLGLTAEVARARAANLPASLGPLRHERSLRRCRSRAADRAVCLARAPRLPDWQDRLIDLALVQTDADLADE